MLAATSFEAAHIAVAERFHPRVDANIMVKVLAHGRSVLFKARDISMNGLFLLDHTGREGHLIHLSIPMPDSVREVKVAAWVRRVDTDGVAVEFDRLDWDDMIALARFVHPRLP